MSSSESEALNHVIINKVNTLKCALIVVDFQNDFVTGSLAIKVGVEILVSYKFHHWSALTSFEICCFRKDLLNKILMML